MPTAITFWDRIAEGYAKKPIADPAAYERTLERTRAHLSPSDRVLELGGGTGTTALRLAPHVAHLTGSDISAGMTEIAQRKAAAAGAANVVFVQRDVFDARLEAAGFDVVLAFNLLHLMPDPAAACRRVHALLRPGGLFISKTGCLKGRYVVLRLLLPLLQRLGRAPHVTILGVEELESVVTTAGFAIVEADTHGDRSPSRFLVARKS